MSVLDTYVFYGLGTYAVLLGSWFAACAPFLLLDATGAADRHRIQRTAVAWSSPRVRAEAARMVLINWAWLLPTVVAAAPALAHLFPSDAPSPSLARAPLVAALWFVLHDLAFYCYHRTLHEVPWLYVRIHKPHHMVTAPFCWSSHAVHPVEMMLQSVGAMSGPLAWAALFGLPVRAWWCWLALVQLQGVMDHSGYDLPAPWECFGMLPGFGGTKFHDDHHQYFQGNYAAALSVIDEVMGTRLQPRRQRGPRELRAGEEMRAEVRKR